MTTSRKPSARFTTYVLALACVFAMSAISRADILNIYTENVDAFDAAQDLGDGENPYGVQTIPEADSPFGDGNAIRMIDLYDGDKPELQGEFAEPLLEPFRIDFQSYNQSMAASSSAIRFRMANSGQSISSESRSAFSVSWQADGKVSAKYQGLADENESDVDTKSASAALDVLRDVTMIANGGLDSNYSYNLFGVERTLDPLSYDIFIDGELLNSSMEGDDNHDDFKGGLAFHLNKSTDYDPALGIQRFGLIGSSNANTDPDVLFDNVILSTGADIAGVPEPGSSLLLLVGASVLMLTRRRQR